MENFKGDGLGNDDIFFTDLGYEWNHNGNGPCRNDYVNHASPSCQKVRFIA